MKSVRTVVHYLVLVGLPFWGVLLVMRVGAKIVPPPSIQGIWLLDADQKANEKTACADRLAGFQNWSIAISQAGVFLEVRIPNPRRDVLAGRLEGEAFVAEAPPALFDDDVFGLLRLSGVVKIEKGEAIMRGVMAMPRRVDCVPVPFVARLASSQSSPEK